MTHPVGRARQPSADRLVARAGQRRLHRARSGRRFRPLPHQGGQADRRARPAAADQERSPVQRAVAPRAGPVPPHLRHRPSRSRSRRWPTTASCRPAFRRGRRLAWSARRACTSARAIPTAWCRAGSVTATFAGGPDSDGRVPGSRSVQLQPGGRVAQLDQPGSRRGAVLERRHSRRPHPGDGADDRPPARTEVGPHVPQPCQRAPAHPGRDPRPQVSRVTASSRRKARGQPIDPDGNPDTSFLARIPADVAFTFQTLDRDGMVLNMAQTWHQLRPGEIRNDCGGCHAHSQKPTLFRDTGGGEARLSDLRPDREHAATDHPAERSVRPAVGQRRARPACATKRRSRTSSTFATSSRSWTAVASPAIRRRTTSRPADLVLDDDKIVDLPNADDVPGHLLPAGDGLRRSLRPASP